MVGIPSRGGGGSGFSLGPEQNEFATDAARNTYATANAAWLALYNADRSFWIQVGGVAGAIQRRNAAGNAWETVTGLIRGPAGGPGAAGGGAIESLGTFTSSASRPALQAIETGIDLDASAEWMGYRLGGVGFVWFNTVDLFDQPALAGGGAAVVSGIGQNVVRIPESAGAQVSGDIYAGHTGASPPVLVLATSNANTNLDVEFYRYVPTAQQGGSGLTPDQESKLAGIEAGATQDQSGAEIKTAYEAEGDTNVYTDAEKTKLGSVAGSANNLIPYKIGNIYRAYSIGALVIKPGNTEGVVTSAGITAAPVGWRLTRPESHSSRTLRLRLPRLWILDKWGF